MPPTKPRHLTLVPTTPTDPPPPATPAPRPAPPVACDEASDLCEAA